MKLKTILTALLFALCSLGATAQTTYPDAVKRFLTISGRVDAVRGQMQEGLSLITQAFLSENGEELPEGYTPDGLVEEYMEKQFLRDWITVLVPTFAEELSIDEINKISDLYETEEGRTAHAHSQEFLNDEKNMLSSIIIVMEAAEKIKSGKKPKKVKTQASKQRQKLFKQYCEQENLMSIFEEDGLDMLYPDLTVANDTAFVDLDNEEELDSEDTEVEEQEPVDQKKLDAYVKYIKKNIVNLLLNGADCLTDDDLRFLVNLTAMPEYKKLLAIGSEIGEDADDYGMALIMKYAEWLEGHE